MHPQIVVLAHKLQKEIICAEYGQESEGINQFKSVKLFFGDFLPGT